MLIWADLVSNDDFLAWLWCKKCTSASGRAAVGSVSQQVSPRSGSVPLPRAAVPLLQDPQQMCVIAEKMNVGFCAPFQARPFNSSSPYQFPTVVSFPFGADERASLSHSSGPRPGAETWNQGSSGKASGSTQTRLGSFITQTFGVLLPRLWRLEISALVSPV